MRPTSYRRIFATNMDDQYALDWQHYYGFNGFLSISNYIQNHAEPEKEFSKRLRQHEKKFAKRSSILKRDLLFAFRLALVDPERDWLQSLEWVKVLARSEYFILGELCDHDEREFSVRHSTLKELSLFRLKYEGIEKECYENILSTISKNAVKTEKDLTVFNALCKVFGLTEADTIQLIKMAKKNQEEKQPDEKEEKKEGEDSPPASYRFFRSSESLHQQSISKEHEPAAVPSPKGCCHIL